MASWMVESVFRKRSADFDNQTELIKNDQFHIMYLLCVILMELEQPLGGIENTGVSQFFIFVRFSNLSFFFNFYFGQSSCILLYV